MKFEPKNIIKDTLWENQSLQKWALTKKRERFSFSLFMKGQTFHYLLDFSLCLTSTFVQSLLLNLNTHHSWIVRSLWPRNSFKYQIYNKRSETAKNNCEYQRVSTFEKRNRGKTRSAFFSCVEKKKIASPCKILRRFFFWACIRLQIASSQNAYVW